VSFWLPGAATAAAAPAPPVQALPERKGNVLLIDDEASVLEIVAEVLSAHGHSVTVARGGREGLLAFAAGRFDLVMTDLGMPDLNGWDVVRSIKESRTTTPVLVLTGWGDTAEAPTGVRPDGFLTKPFDLKRLAAEVGAVISRA